MANHPKYVRYNGEEWSALYIDGKLDTVGDSYHSDERLAEILGVQEYDDDAFLRGGDGRSDVAQTLDELHTWQAQRDTKLAQAEELRARAAELEAEAKALRETARVR